MVTVNLTDRCNQKCIYCEIGANSLSSRNKTLTLEEMKWIIDQMDEAGIRKISLCGGEPFLFDGLLELIAYAGKKKIRCSVTTNGMTAHRLDDSMLDVLKSCGTEINISIDSFDEQVNALTRGTEVALPNALMSLKRLAGKGIPVTVLTVISKYTYSNLYAYIEKANGLGIRQVLFQPVIFSTNYPGEPAVQNKQELNVSPGEAGILMEELDKILRFERHHPIKTNVYRIRPWIRHYLETAADPGKGFFFDRILNKFYCREVDAIIDITYDGGIQPCGLTPASISIREDPGSGLIAQWSRATETIRGDLEKGQLL